MQGATPREEGSISAAEQVFLEFKRIPRPYELCFAILKATNNDYVVFETFSAIKEAVAREFTQMTTEAVTDIRDRVFSFITEHHR